MSVTTGTFPGVRIVDMPDLGAVNDSSSMVGERAGSGRFAATAFRSYVSSYIAAGLPWINVRDYGATGGGVTDDTVAINAAYAAVPASGAVVVFPQGTYIISTAIVVGRSNTVTEGCNSEIRTTSATADHFQLVAGVVRLVFRDLSLWATVAKTAGAGFKALGTIYESCWYNVQVGSVSNYQALGGQHRLNNGFDFQLGLSRVYLDPGSIVVTAHNGIIAASGAELTIDCRILFCAIGCLLGGAMGGVYFGGEISQCGTGVLCATTITGATNREIFFGERSIIDSCTDYALHIAAGSVSILDITGSWFTSAGRVTAGQNVGLFIEAAATFGNARITGARFYNNVGSGLVNAGMEIAASGCLFDYNGTGAILEGAGANNSMIDGCKFSSNTTGIIVQNGITFYQLTNNGVTNNGTAIAGNAIGWTNAAGQVIRGNTGYLTRTNGQAIIANGASAATFNHGLPDIPHGAILLTGNQQNHTLAVGTVTATQITVHSDTNVTADLAFSWEASMGPFA